MDNVCNLGEFRFLWESLRRINKVISVNIQRTTKTRNELSNKCYYNSQGCISNSADKDAPGKQTHGRMRYDRLNYDLTSVVPWVSSSSWSCLLIPLVALEGLNSAGARAALWLHFTCLLGASSWLLWVGFKTSRLWLGHDLWGQSWGMLRQESDFSTCTESNTMSVWLSGW